MVKWKMHPMVRGVVLACTCCFGVLSSLALVLMWATDSPEFFPVVIALGIQQCVTNVAAMHFGGQYV